jgi:hypothetical protein
MGKELETEIENFLKSQQTKLEDYQREKITSCFDQNSASQESFAACYNTQYQFLKRLSKRQEVEMVFFQMNLQKCIQDT